MTVEVRFLGTGDAFASGGRSHACILVTAPEGRILLDCGGSSLPAIVRACDPTTIDAVAITHLHGDHFGGLPYLVMHQKYAPRSRPLVVGGPPSLEERYLRSMRGLYVDFFHSPCPFDVQWSVLTPTPVTLGPAEVSAHPVEHVPASEPHGLRVRIGGKLIAFSGDAKWSAAIPPLADGADLFISETTAFSLPDPVHMSAKELAANRGQLRCKRLIATHLGKDSVNADLASLGLERAEEGLTVVI